MSTRHRMPSVRAEDPSTFWPSPYNFIMMAYNMCYVILPRVAVWNTIARGPPCIHHECVQCASRMSKYCGIIIKKKKTKDQFPFHHGHNISYKLKYFFDYNNTM